MANLEENRLVVKFKKNNPILPCTIPKKAYNGDAGWDLFAAESVTIKCHETKKITTNLCVKIPDGYFGLVQDRSGLGSKGYSIHGGVIDSSYRGPIDVIFHNDNNAELPITILEKDKIAQLLILPVPDIEFIETLELDETDRNNKGFGSSDSNSFSNSEYYNRQYMDPIQG